MTQEYLAYLLRLQRNERGDPWRTILQNAHTGEVVRFANERDMFRYLMRVLAAEQLAPEEEAEELEQ